MGEASLYPPHMHQCDPSVSMKAFRPERMPPAQLTPLSSPASLPPRSSMHPQIELWAQLHASLLDYCIAQGLNAWADVQLRTIVHWPVAMANKAARLLGTVPP